MKITIISLIFIALAFQLKARDSKNDTSTDDVKYRRSSLHMVVIESESFPNKEIVMKSWNKYPFPDKYNNHIVDVITMNPKKYEVTDDDLKLINKPSKGAFGNFAKSIASDAIAAASEATGGAIDSTSKYMPIKIDKFIKETDLAKKLVAKWFNRTEDGKFNTKLIEERGFYNASEMDMAIASGQARGMAALGDAGEELINNTFVTFSKLSFVPNEPIARAIRDAAIETAKEQIKIPLALNAAIKAADALYEKTKEGYSIWTNTWLYKLTWNDSISRVFYTELWNNKEAFDKTNIFELEYVGKESSSSLVTFSLKEKRTEEQIIDIATVRSVDKVFAKLQKEYDVFKPKVPVISTNPIAAKIGLKEGVKPGDKFEVLEMLYNPKSGKTEYKTVGKISIDKKAPIWDNRYAAGEKSDKTNSDNVFATTFKGSKKVQPGMLLKQIK